MSFELLNTFVIDLLLRKEDEMKKPAKHREGEEQGTLVLVQVRLILEESNWPD